MGIDLPFRLGKFAEWALSHGSNQCNLLKGFDKKISRRESLKNIFFLMFSSQYQTFSWGSKMVGHCILFHTLSFHLFLIGNQVWPTTKTSFSLLVRPIHYIEAVITIPDLIVSWNNSGKLQKLSPPSVSTLDIVLTDLKFRNFPPLMFRPPP